MTRVEMTAEGLAALRAEIDRLEGEERTKIAEEIKVARGYGDLSENAEYHAAKEAQAHLETKIRDLRARLTNAEVVEAASGGVVGLGATVELEDAETGRRSTYEIVAAHEASPSQGRLSNESPVATALRGRKAGEEATVTTPRGERRMRVVAVR